MDEARRELTREEIDAENDRLSAIGDRVGSMLAELIEVARELRTDVGPRNSPGRQMHLVVTNLEQAGLWLILANEELHGAQIADGILTDGLRRI